MRIRESRQKAFLFVFIMAFAVSTTEVFCVSDGGVVAPILSYSLGSRGYAMGGAFTALADDTTAAFWNPAGLTEIHRQEVSAYFETLFAGTTFLFGGYTYPIWNVGVASISVMYMGTPEIPKVSEDLENLGTYSSFQLLINLAYAQKLSFYKKFVPWLKYFDAGVNLKVLTAGLADNNRLGIGLDLGIKYYPTHITAPRLAFLRNFVLALKFNNLVPPTVQFNSGRDWYLWELNFGILYRTLYDTLNLTMDIDKTMFSERAWKLKVGAEYTLFRIIKIRAGYNGEITAGLGINLEDFRFDYAFGYNLDLGMLHHISATYYFGEIIP
jgi:hypothetical protein